MLSAISFGVLRRSAPSTRAIMRSRNDLPGSCVTSITSRSESSFVPPVTAERSPPDSRMTGADSPVIADSSTEPTPSMISPSAGMTSPASTMTTSPRCSSAAGTVRPSRSDRIRRRARRAQRVRLCLAAALGDRLGEVREQHGQPEPDRDRGDEPEAARLSPRTRLRKKIPVVITLPSSTMNITGFRTCEPRIELRERVADRSEHQLAREDAAACARPSVTSLRGCRERD